MSDYNKRKFEALKRTEEGSPLEQIARQYQQNPAPRVVPTSEFEKFGNPREYFPEVRPGQTPEEMAAYERALQKVLGMPPSEDDLRNREELEMEEARRKFQPKYPAGRRGL